MDYLFTNRNEGTNRMFMTQDFFFLEKKGLFLMLEGITATQNGVVVVVVVVCRASQRPYRLLNSSFFLVQSMAGALLLERF